MQTIYFEVHKNSLSISKTISTITSGTVNYIELHFTFDSDWMSLSKTALFFNTDRAEQQQVLLTGDTCMIPHELTQQPGDVAFGLVGIAGDTRATTNIYTIKIKQGAYIEGETPPSPSVDIYQQIVNKMQAVLDGTSTAAATATEKAQEAETSRTAAETAAAQAEADREAVGQVKIDVATIAGQVREDTQSVAADKANVSALTQIVQESADKVNRDLSAVQQAAADTEANAREAQAAQASAIASKAAAETAAVQVEKNKGTVDQIRSEVTGLAEQAQKDAQTAFKSKQDAQTAATTAAASQTAAKDSESSAASSASSALQAKQTVDTLAQQAAESAQTARTETEKATAEAERIAALDTYSRTEARMQFAPAIEERVEGLGTVHITSPVAQTTLLSCSMLGDLTEILADPSQEKSPDNPSTIFGVGQNGSVHLAMGSKVYEIPLDQPLYALPDGSWDEITADGNFISRVGKIVLDGSRKWAVYEIEDKNYCQAYIIAMDDIGGDNGKLDGGKIFCVSNLLPCYGKIHTGGEHITTWEWYAMKPGMGRLDIRVLASRLASPDEAGLRAWLAEHPITVYYLRQHPVVSEVPSVVEAIRAIATQDGDLSCTDPVKPYLAVSYPFDTKSYVDRFDENAYTKADAQELFAPSIPENTSGLGNIAVVDPAMGTTFQKFSICGATQETLLDPTQSKGPMNPATCIGAGNTGIVQLAMKETNISIAVPQPLHSLPNGERDEITQDGRFIRRVGTLTLNGASSEDWVAMDIVAGSLRFYIRNVVDYIGWENNLWEANNFFCTHFSTIASTNTLNGLIGIGAYINNFYFWTGFVETLDEWRTWLAEHPVTVYYQLKNPIITVLPPTTLETLNEIQPVDGIMSSSDSVPPYLKAVYCKDTLACINSRMELKTDQVWTSSTGYPLFLIDCAAGLVRNFCVEGNSTSVDGIEQGISGSLNLVSIGKNLLFLNDPGRLVRGNTTFYIHENGAVTFNGVVSSDGYADLYSDYFILPAGTYTAGNRIFVRKDSQYFTGTFTLEEPSSVRAFLRFQRGDTTETMLYPQLEFGKSATSFEPYNSTHYMIPLRAQNGDELQLLSGDSLQTVGGVTTLIRADGTKIYLCHEAQKAIQSIKTLHRITTIYGEDALPPRSIRTEYKQNLQAFIEQNTLDNIEYLTKLEAKLAQLQIGGITI